MDGLSSAKEVFSLISEIGTLPSLLIMAVCLFFILREVKGSVSSIKGSLKTELGSLKDSLEVIRQHSNKQDADLLKKIDEFKDKIDILEERFITREQHYRDYEACKKEIQELRVLIIGYIKKDV